MSKHHFYSPTERALAATYCRQYRDRWALSTRDMALQMGTTSINIEDVEALQYRAGMARIIGRLLTKDLHKKPRKMRI